MTMNMVELQSNNQGFEESNTGFYFPPSPTHFPLYRPLRTVFFVSCQQDRSLALSCQHIFVDKSGALHVMIKGVEQQRENIFGMLFQSFMSYLENEFKFVDWEQILTRAAGVVPEDMVSLVKNIADVGTDKEVTIRRINGSEQHDQNIVDQPIFKQVGVVHQLIQNRCGELDVILGGRVSKINGLEYSHGQGSPTTLETLLICQAKVSLRKWLGHGGQLAVKIRYRCNHHNIGSFTTVVEAILAYEMEGEWMEGSYWFSGLPGLFLLQLPPPAQEEKPDEDFGLVCCNAMRNDEIEVVGIRSAGTGDCVIAYQARLNSRCLGKRKTKENNPGGERKNKKTNRVRIAIPLEDILQTKGMWLKDAANHLEGMHTYTPTRNENLIRPGVLL